MLSSANTINNIEHNSHILEPPGKKFHTSRSNDCRCCTIDFSILNSPRNIDENFSNKIHDNEFGGFEDKTLLKEQAIGSFKTTDLEKEMILRTLEYFNNNRRAAAKSLGMSERTLYRKINDYGIEKKINKDN